MYIETRILLYYKCSTVLTEERDYTFSSPNSTLFLRRRPHVDLHSTSFVFLLVQLRFFSFQERRLLKDPCVVHQQVDWSNLLHGLSRSRPVGQVHTNCVNPGILWTHIHQINWQLILSLSLFICARVCVCVYVRACVRACLRVNVSQPVCVCMRARLVSQITNE